MPQPQARGSAVAARRDVWLGLGTPVIFRQTRVGRHGRLFTIYKFRGMLPDRRLESRPWPVTERRLDHEPTHDPRHTRLGLFLETWSLDELPQLWNIVRGEMSFVGPRPELPVIVASYADWQHERHLVKPGLTGLRQITYRTHKPMYDHVDYVRHVSAGLDLHIFLRTLPAAVSSRRGWTRPPAEDLPR